MPQDFSAMVFIAFGILALCVLIALFMLMSDWFLLCWRFVMRACKSVRGAHDNLHDHMHDDAYDDAPDDISADAAQVLVMLNTPTVVVDADNDVIRASSEAYMLGVVIDDSIAQSRVLQAINTVRASGGCERFALVTSTPDRYITIGDGGNNEVSVSSVSSVSSDRPTIISRPNWLTITVGSIGHGMVAVVIEDTSATHRFAQTRDDFISNVSEQLLCSTRTLTQLTKVLQEDNISTQKVKEVAQIANKSSKKLEHMLEDLLWLVRAQNPIDMSTAKVLSVREMLCYVQEQVSSLADSCCVRVILKVDSSLHVHGEVEQIRTAIRKLVENAIIYSPANAVVAISASLSADGQYAVIRVVDRGIGIDLQDQSRIFERFYRAHNQNSQSQDGVGLGLAIAKHVVLTHHGNITLWSRPRQGTTVSFALPVVNN